MPESTEIADDPLEPPGLLRRRDQPLLAYVALIAGLAVLVWWNPNAAPSRRATEWGNLRTRPARFEVDVNTASWPELSQLPEIGETLARRIVENRQTEGPFSSPNDLTRVRGIGNKTLDQMRPYLRSDCWSHETSQGAPDTP